ncbi:MAG: HEAT repeat domain-containing protein [Candidatus Brocadiia bacterium]
MKRNEKFSARAFDAPLFIQNPEQLVTKINSAEGLLANYWQDYRERILADEENRNAMIYLDAFLSEENRQEACERLQKYFRRLPKQDNAGGVQFHTWCRCGSITRRSAFFDWLAWRGAWSEDEIEEAAECFLGFAFKHPYMVLSARSRASDNQAISMALHCAVVGFLFGYKLADHPTGKFLFDYGMGRIPDLIGLFPGDGYSGEGSTYTSRVNTPLAYWMCELLSQLTGRDWQDEPFEPNGTTLGKMIEMELHLMSPGGLLAPWDHYGWQKEVNASPFAYLARLKDDPRYLSLIGAMDIWGDSGYLAWGADDPMWTLLWWPKQYLDWDRSDVPEDLFTWFLPRTGAALDDVKRKSRLMQVWDRSGETIAGLGRAQVNPNHVIFEWDGEPVFQDGVPEKEDDPWRYPPEKVLGVLSEKERERYVAYRRSIGGKDATLKSVTQGAEPGLIGAANAIVVDDEPWFWPPESRVGNAKFFQMRDGIQAVCAECQNFYQPTYDVTLARRSCLWADRGIGLIVDELKAQSSHTWRWQTYLRPGAELNGQQVRISLATEKEVFLAWEDGAGELRQFEGFPKTQEGRSVRLDRKKKGQEISFVTAVGLGFKTLDTRWVGERVVEVEADGEKHLFVVANFEGQPCSAGGKQITASFAWLNSSGTCIELYEGEAGKIEPDTNRLPDIVEERCLQKPEIRGLVPWSASGKISGDGLLSELDECLEELAKDSADVGKLEKRLSASRWPVQAAAADVLGRSGAEDAASVLRDKLEQEHAIAESELYPKMDSPDDETAAKRWRLKMILIQALGRLGDEKAVGLLGQILSDGRDFYTVYSATAQALGRIGGKEALEALGPAFEENEINTRTRALAARRYKERRE